MEKKFKRYEFEGITVDIPLIYNEAINKYLEEYPDFIENPIYTAKGMPLTLSIEDACENAKATDMSILIDCSDCIYFQRADEKTLFGYCSCEKNIRL